MNAPARTAPARGKLDAFRWGFVVGFVAPVAAPLFLWGALKLSIPGLEAPAFNVELVSAGADVSLHGGTRVVMANERGAITQTCREECDDLRARENSGDNAYWVRVLDRSGACVACSPAGVYVTNGYGAPLTTFVVGGKRKLTVRWK